MMVTIPNNTANNNINKNHSKKDGAHFTDVVSRVLFPCGYVIFNIIYWTVYLNKRIEYAPWPQAQASEANSTELLHHHP